MLPRCKPCPPLKSGAVVQDVEGSMWVVLLAAAAYLLFVYLVARFCAMNDL
jgi:hypothetical protein